MDNSMYSEIAIVAHPKMRVARHTVVSASPEQDAISHMDAWARECGLAAHPGYKQRTFGWDFPYVSQEQQEKFGMHGYTFAYVLPEDFEPDCPGVEIADIDAGNYAMLTISEPFSAPDDRIPGGFQRLLAFATGDEHRLPEQDWGNRYLMEEVREQDGRAYMDIYFPVK